MGIKYSYFLPLGEKICIFPLFLSLFNHFFPQPVILPYFCQTEKYTPLHLHKVLFLYFQDAVPGWNGIVEHDCTVAGCRNNDVRIIGTPTLVLFLVIAFAGMDWVTRVQKALLVLLILAQLDMFAGSFIDIEFGSGYIQLENDTFGHIGQSLRHSLGYTGWSIDTAEINLNPQYTNSPMSSGNQPDFAEVFGVFFTAVTGIVAGANLSGDLKDPSSAIPKGTLWAIGFTYVTYFFFAICTGFTYLPQASGIAEEYNFHGLGGDSILGSYNGTAEFPLGFPRWDDCSAESNAIRDMYTNATSFPALEYIYKEWQEGKGCLHGSAMDQMTMTYICFTGYLRYAGGFSASLSSAIASLVGAPRVLQAVGKDKIYPFANFFAKGYTANNDPFRGYILVFVIAFAFVMIASLNEISVIASNFFLAAYALMNLSCFHSSMTKSPGWRPSFKFYNPWVALASTFLCVGMMFVLSPMYAGITIGIILVLGVYILWMDPEANWGSSTQAQTFLSALKSTREITNAPDHIKTYRPKILLFSGNPAHRPSLVDFAHLITKKTSLLICGDVMDEQNIKPIPTMREHVQAWLKDHNLNAFYNPTIGSNFEEGAKNCILNAGLGKLSPNMVLMGFKNDWRTDLKGLDAYVNTMYNSFDANMAVGIMRVEGGCDFSGTIGSEQITEVKVKKSDVVDDEDQGLGVPGVKRMRKVSSYHSPDGQKLSSTVVSNIQQFREKHTGFIDVWWLYDDGGLTLLLPYIIQTRKIYKDCTLRVFSLATRTDQLVAEQRSLATLLAKFRIEFSDVIIIPDVTKKADPSTKAEFDAMISGMPSDVMTESILQEEREKTNRFVNSLKYNFSDIVLVIP